MTKTDSRTVISRITDFGPKPKSAVKALQQAHAFLCQEGVWVQDWFEDGDPKEAFEKGMCDSARACSMSAIGLVTGEGPVSVLKSKATRYDREVAEGGYVYYFEPYTNYDPLLTPVSYKAATRLAAVVNGDDPDTDIDPVGTVIEANDSCGNNAMGRTQVLDNFAAAIRAAGREPLVDHTRSLLSIKQQLGKLKRKVKSA